MQHFNGKKVLLPIAVAGVLSACGGGGDDNGGGPPPGTTGTLNLTVNGLAGNGDVDAQPASGAARNLIEGANTLPAGTYTLVVNSISQDGSIVDSAFTGTANQASVTIAADGTVGRTVTYTEQPGRLWLPVANTLNGYDETELTTDPAAPAAVTITGAGTTAFNTVFDAAGNMWVADGGTDALLFYSVDQLATGGSGPPDATINTDASSSLATPVGMAFDADGNLWVGNYGSDTLVQYSAAQLTAAVAAGTSAPTPDVIIDSPDLSGPYGQAFDATGNLWVASNSSDTVAQFAAADLAASGTVAAAQSTNAKVTGTLDAPRGPAFDADGNLWVASRNTDQVVQYTIDANGVPTAALDVNVFLADGTTPLDPTGLAFDNAGDLWVSDGGNDVLAKFTAANLADGTAAADTSITGAGNIGSVLFSFSPSPEELPINP